jgi:DNA-binding response OmpR family regulator
MVYGTVQRHGAEIEIESLIGRGTTVRLSFSAAPAAPVPSVDSKRIPAVVPRSRILLVDDDPVLLKSLADTLEADGHAVLTADGGAEGIRAFEAALTRGECFGIVITDLGMPYVDGRKVAAAVKERSPSTPVIMLTGWGQRLIAEGELPTHVDHLLSKPTKMVKLRETLAACCQKSAKSLASK